MFKRFIFKPNEEKLNCIPVISPVVIPDAASSSYLHKNIVLLSEFPEAKGLLIVSVPVPIMYSLKLLGVL